jgi:hypothetical protein
MAATRKNYGGARSESLCEGEGWSGVGLPQPSAASDVAAGVRGDNSATRGVGSDPRATGFSPKPDLAEWRIEN